MEVGVTCNRQKTLLELSRITEVNTDVARRFVERWHYSERLPTGKNILLAWYAEIDGVAPDTLFGETIYALADYGIGVNPYQADFLARVTECDVSADSLIELKRLCRIEPKVEELPLSAFLARCHRILKEYGFRYVVAFSDPHHGHTGGIYRAANFQHLGVTNPERHTYGMAMVLFAIVDTHLGSLDAREFLLRRRGRY